MPSTLSELTSWERAKARNRQREMLVRAEAGDADAQAWLARKNKVYDKARARRLATRRKECKRKQILKDANLFYYYQPETFIVLL